MPKILPVANSSASRQEIIIEDVPYGLNLIWNERAGAWSLGLDDRDGLQILSGRRVVLQLDLFYGYRHLPGMPQGFLYALDTTNKLKSVSREDLIIGRAILQYYTQAEINAL
jgi:hypothetical protein